MAEMPKIDCAMTNPTVHTMKSIVYDKQVALAQAGGDPGTARRFLDMLLESLSQAERSFYEALDRNDLHDLKENAHRLAGAAPYCGAVALHESAKRLESRAREGDPELNAALTRELIDQIALFRNVISMKDS
jgi:HPt (histidine-containing phosphotransfer) domain-containing protein